MFSVQVKYNHSLVRLKKNKKIDKLISEFIKECVVRVKGKTEDLLGKTKFYLFNDKNPMGLMIWAQAEGIDSPVLIVQRDDRKDNVYIYDTDGFLVSHKKIKGE